MRISIQTSPHSIRFFLKIVTMKHSIASRQPVPASQHTPLCSIHFLPEDNMCFHPHPYTSCSPSCHLHQIGTSQTYSAPLPDSHMDCGQPPTQKHSFCTARFKLPASICILPPVSSYYIFRYGCRIRILPGACSRPSVRFPSFPLLSNH